MTAIPALIDIGANLAHKSFTHDLSQVLERARSAGLRCIIVTGSDLPSTRRAIELAGEYPGFLYATAGLHPHHADHFSIHLEEELRSLGEHPSVRAVGETGLDFHRNYSSPAKQEQAFERLLYWAADTGMPLFLHEREAGERMCSMLSDLRDRLGKAVIHCFTGDRALLFRYLDLDLHIGVTGWLCDPQRGAHLHSLLKHIPPGRLMIETDAPWLLPKNRTQLPVAEKRRNEPSTLPCVLEDIALHCGRPAAEIAAETAAVAEDFFNLPATQSR